MELTSQQTLPVAQQLAWEALNDTAMLQAAIPGCESITPTEPNQFDVAVTAAIDPVKAKFKGKLRLEDITPPTSYTLYFEGQGGAAGHGKGSATVRLEAKGANQTLLHYTATASVGGKIAQVGSRLVDMAAQKMAGEFFAKFTEALIAKHGVQAPPEPAATAASGGSLLARLLRWLRGLLGR
jgi:carbon monoxide dehydrogenase subunit G